MAETEIESLRNAGHLESTSESSANSLAPYVVPVIILVHVSLTIFLAFKLNIWVDEAFTLRTTGRGVGYALRQAVNFEMQAPLYFVILSIWRKLDSSIFVARLLSVVYVALSLKVVASLSRRLWKDLQPGWLVAVVAFNPLTISVAVDARLYGQVLLLSVLLLLTFYDGYLAQSSNKRAQACYVLLAVVALYTHYYTGFLLAGNGIALLVLRRWRPLLQYLFGMTVAGLLFGPMVPFIRYQMSAHTEPIKSGESLFMVAKTMTWRMKEYLLPNWWNWSLEVRSWVLRVCYLAALVILFKKRKNLTPELFAMWTASIVVALCFLIIARLAGGTLLQPRHTVVLFIPLSLAVFAIVVLAKNNRVLYCWTGLVLIFCVTGLYTFANPLAKPGDWQRVGSYLMANEKPAQPILVFHAGAALPLAHYYAGSNLLIPLPRENTFERFDFHDYVLRDEREIIVALKRVPGDHEVVWLVTDRQCGFADLSYHCEILEEFVSKYYSVEETASFRNSMVRRLRQKQEF